MSDAKTKPSTKLQSARSDIVSAEIGRLADASYALTRWFIASLLILHGGALVSLMSVEQNRAELMVRVGWTFAAGLVLALLSGVLLSIGYSYAAIGLSKSLWNSEEIDGEDIGHWYGKRAWGSGGISAGVLLSFISVAFFIFGCYDFSDEVYEIIGKSS